MKTLIQIFVSIIISLFMPLLFWLFGADITHRGTALGFCIVFTLWLFGGAITCPAWWHWKGKNYFM